MKLITKTFLILFITLITSACATDVTNSSLASSPSQEAGVADNFQSPAEIDSETEMNYCSFGSELTLTSVTDISGIDPANVYTCVCELLEQRPEQQTTYCADFGVLVYDIKWDKWDASGATGTGIYSTKICEPSCADGTRLDAPVKVFLSDLKTDGQKYYLMKFRYEGEEPFIPNEPITDTWDVGF